MNAFPRKANLIRTAVLLIALGNRASLHSAAIADNFTRLTPLPPPRITDCATEFPGASYKAAHILDGNLQTEYASHGKGTNTFIEFDFGQPVTIAGLQHRDRNDVATIAESELTFLDTRGRVIGAERVTHVNQRSGVTAWPLARPVTAQRLRWRISQAGSQHGCLGGAELVFFTHAPPESLPHGVGITLTPATVLENQGAQIVQPLRFAIEYPYAEACDAVFEAEGFEPHKLHLKWGRHEVALSVPEIKSSRSLRYVLRIHDQTVTQGKCAIEPVKPMTVYILPHSHVDIGYTEPQGDVEKKQMRNLARALELIRMTAGFPEGARYKWNVEVLWAVESYLRAASVQQQQEFVEAVRRGQIGLQALYGNELTGLCRPEELMQLFAYAMRLGQRCGVPVDSAMISDVPGYTWGIVAAMAQAGVKYWSIGPNFRDRIGHTRVAWEDKPFWWVGPSGKEKVLCALPYTGYALSHLTPPPRKSARILELLDYLRQANYPYDLVHLRWSGYGDNAVPDESLPDWVKDWNERYASPRLVIATASEAFREFEKRHGDKLPRVAGDWTPYWEDGAGSTARETALNRASADRLAQAETLWSMLAPARRPAGQFADAWRNILLYSEHTWGAHCSISKPDDPSTTGQWRVKQGFALDADRQSRALLADALATRGAAPTSVEAIDVFNTTQWARTDLASLPKNLQLAGGQVADASGRFVPTQRLSSGEWVFLAREVPAFGAKRFHVLPGLSGTTGQGKVEGNRLITPRLTVEVDTVTGAIKSLRRSGADTEFVDREAPVAINDYRYVLGTNAAGAQANGPVTITVMDAGPLVAALRITSVAPGCNQLVREVRVIDGLDRVELVNHVDRTSVREKDAVHFGFGFNVPRATVRLETPWAVVRPNADQMPGACYNWFSVQRWVDFSNPSYGITWAPLDAPLLEMGAITANLLGPVPLADWMARAIESPTIYSWAQNNHWHTNYKADQPGVTTFRYVLRPHKGGYAGADAARFGMEITRPLIAIPAENQSRTPVPLLSVSSPDVLVETLKVSEDGQAHILRLFGVSGRSTTVKLIWAKPSPRTVWLSDLSEKPLRPVKGAVAVPAYGVVTLRADRTD